ncbi:histone-lysine N-methyltransferase SETMAR [Elysia marginata]|uniref:Histone-lysine N-methyltransferase SETMAR n=1 Tax=Elysia marginata TaxID=1093978 RepID=A0AAV4JG84_9GAST|nr:histone-lysine N-methyltransferase SETMAR [Elysia marginata]
MSPENYMLADDRKRQIVEISQILLYQFQQEGNETVAMGPGRDHRARNKLLEHLITGDETWLHLSTSETKLDSMTWKHPSSPVTKKKFKVQQSAAKVMAIQLTWNDSFRYSAKRRESQC